MKKKIEYNINKGLPGGSNELKVSGAVSIEGYKRNSPDVNNKFNIIQSSNITMKDVDFPLVGIDNLGNKQIMYPGGEYTFPGHTVLEVPLAQSGEEIPKDRDGDVYVGDKQFSDKPMHEGHQPSTHLMADDDNKTAWPTLFQDDEGVWYQPDNPREEAERLGELYTFDTREEMIAFAREGNWKPKMQEGGQASHPFEQWASEQGMTAQEALELISQNPDSYDAEIVNLAREYYTELQHYNPVNDKQDELSWAEQDQYANAELPQAQKGRESRKERKEREEREAKELEELKRKNEERGKQLQSDFEANNSVEINTEGMRKPLRVYPNPIPTDYTLENPELDPMNITPRNYITDRLEYWQDPDSLAQERYEGDFINQYPFILPPYLNEPSITEDWMEEDKLVNFDLYGVDDIQRKDFNEQVDLFENNLSNIAFVDLKPNEKKASDALKGFYKNNPDKNHKNIRGDKTWKEWYYSDESFDYPELRNYIYYAQGTNSMPQGYAFPFHMGRDAVWGLARDYGIDIGELGEIADWDVISKKLTEVGEDPNDPKFADVKGLVTINPDINLITPGDADEFNTATSHEITHHGMGHYLPERERRILSDLNISSDNDKHLNDEEETYSDLMAVRQDMLDKGVYDYRNDQMTIDHWQEYLNQYKEEEYPLVLKRMLERYRVDDENVEEGLDKDQNIIYINNVVADSEIDDDIDNFGYAQRGGSLSQFAGGGGYDFMMQKQTQRDLGISDEDIADNRTTSEKLDHLQTMLSAGGLTPAYGIVPDLINTAVSGGRGFYSWLTGDKDGTTKHMENMAINATSAVPGPVGWTAGGAGLAKDMATYTGLREDESMYASIENFAENNETPEDTEGETMTLADLEKPKEDVQELPKAQKGNETIMIMGDAARANEAGLDTEYSDLRGKEKIQDERFPGMYDSTLEAFKEIVKDESPEIQQLLYNTWYNVGRPSIKLGKYDDVYDSKGRRIGKKKKSAAYFNAVTGIKAHTSRDLMEEFGHAYQTYGDQREDTDFWSNPFSRSAYTVMDFLPTTWHTLKGLPYQWFGRSDFGLGQHIGTGLWDWVDDNIVDLDQTSPYKNKQSMEGVHKLPGARGYNWLDGLRTTYDYLKNYSDKDDPLYMDPNEWNKQHTGRQILNTKNLLGQSWGTGHANSIIDQGDLDQYYEEFGIDKDPQLWIYNPNFDFHGPGNTFGDYPFAPWKNSKSTERYLDYYDMSAEDNLNKYYDLNYWGVKQKGGSTDDLIQPVLNEDGSVKTVKYGTKEYKDAYNAGELAEWRTDESHPDGGYWTRWLPEITLTDTSPETDWINNKINNPSWMSRLLGRDPGEDWMGVDWERSLHNPYYNQRQYDTNPVARAVMDKTGQTPGSSPFGGTWADVVSDAPLYSAIGVPAISTLGVYAPGVLGTTIPGTGGSLTIGGGLNLAGGAYSGYHLPGDVQDFAKDPSLRTGANVGLDLLGLSFGGYEVANMASKFKFSPLLQNTTNLKPSYSGIIERPYVPHEHGMDSKGWFRRQEKFGPEDIILAKEVNTHGYNYSNLANSRLADLQKRMQTDEFRLRMKGLIDEEIIGPGKLFTTRPVTEAGKVNQYEQLVNNTIDDMIADALKMRIVNTTDDLGYFTFDNAGMKKRIPGSIQKGLPRIGLNKNLPYNSTANIPVTDHEIGHFFQSGISDYLPYNIGKIHPKHFDNPHIKQTLTTKLKKDLSEIYPQYTGKTGVYNTDIDRAIQKNLRIDPEYRLGDLSKPAKNSFDWGKPETMSSRQVDHVLRNLGETEGLKSSYNYFARMLQPNPKDFSKLRISPTNRIGTSKEGLPYLSEVRGDMLQRGFIKNTYDEITPFKVNSYLKALNDQKNMLGTPGFTGHYTPRLTQFMAKDADNINYLSKMLNKLPAIIPPAAATPFLLDEQSRNPTYQEGGQIYGPSETSFIDDDDDGLPVGIDRYDKPYEVLFEDLEKGIRWAESKNGELMKNEQENSTATGLYGQRFSEIEKGNKNNIGVVYEGTRDDFEKDVEYQKKLFHDLAHKKSGLIDNGRDLFEEYYYQIKDLPYNATELGALSNMLGRQGTRKYLGYVLRDGKSLEEVFPTLYGSGKIVTNKTPEVYIKEFNEGILKLKRGGDPIKRRKRLWQQLKKHRKGEKISGLAKLELKDRGLIKEEKNNLNLKHINADGDITFGFEYDFKNTNLKKVSRGGESDLTLNQQIKFYEDYVNSMYDGTRNFKKAKSLFEKINRFYLLDAKKDNSHVLKHMKKLRKAQVGGTIGDIGNWVSDKVDSALSYVNPYNYEGWFDRYPTIKADNFQDAFATAQKEHADSEYFLYKGKRFINELKGESKHHQPTQDILDRIQNSETLDQSVKDNFMNLWSDLNQPYLNIGDNPLGPKGRDHVDSWSKGRPNLYIKDYNWHKRDDKQLIVDIINELTHVKQHNDMGRRKYLTKYLGELVGVHGHQHDLYDKEGTLEYAAHAGDIRPELEAYVFGEPISEIGSREAASVAPYQIDPEKVDNIRLPETEEVGERVEPTYAGIMGTIGNIFGFKEGGESIPQWFKDSVYNIPINQGFLPTVDVGPKADATKYYEERLPYYNYLSNEQKQHLNDVYLGEVPESPIFDNIIGQGREGYGIGNNPTYMESVHDFAGAFPKLAGKNLLETLTIPQATLVEGIEAARGNPYNFKNVFPSVDRNLFGKQRFPSTTFLQDAPLGWQIAGDIAIDPVAIFGLGKLGQLGARSLNTAARNRKLATTLSSTMDDALTTPTNYNTVSRPSSIFDGINPGFGQSDELVDDAYKAIGSSGKDKIYSTSQIGDLTVTNASKNLLTDMSNAANTGKFVDNSFPQIGLVNGKLNTPNKTQITKFDDALNTAFDYKGMEDGTNVALTRIIDSKGLAVVNGKLTFKIAPHMEGSKEALKIQRYNDVIKNRNTTHLSFSHIHGNEYHSPHGSGNWRNKSTAVINNINDLKKHGELLNISPSDTYFYTKNNMFVGDQALVLTRDKKLYDNITKNAPKTNIYYVGKNVTDDQFAEIVNSFHRHAGSSSDMNGLFHNYVGNELIAGRDVGRFKALDKEHYLKDFSSNNPSTFSGGFAGHDPIHRGSLLTALERAANFKNLKYIGPELKSNVNPSGKLPSRRGTRTDLIETYQYPYLMDDYVSPGNIQHQSKLLNKYIPYPEMKESPKAYKNWLKTNSFENLSGYPIEVQINEIEKLASSGFDTKLLNTHKEWLALDNGFDTWTDMVASSKYSTMKRKGGEVNSLKQY